MISAQSRQTLHTSPRAYVSLSNQRSAHGLTDSRPAPAIEPSTRWLREVRLACAYRCPSFHNNATHALQAGTVSSMLRRMKLPSNPRQSVSGRSASRWNLLLVLPLLFLSLPWLYARNAPTVFGFPFFYWYQFIWIVISSGLMALVYRRTGSWRSKAGVKS